MTWLYRIETTGVNLDESVDDAAIEPVRRHAVAHDISSGRAPSRWPAQRRSGHVVAVGPALAGSPVTGGQRRAERNRLDVALSLIQAVDRRLWHTASDVSLTAEGTGSGAGIDAAISGKARIGASDAYMSDEQSQQNRDILNVPLAISAQTVNYNVPGLNDAGLSWTGQRSPASMPVRSPSGITDAITALSTRASGSTQPIVRSVAPTPRAIPLSLPNSSISRPRPGGQDQLQHQRRVAGGRRRAHRYRQ